LVGDPRIGEPGAESVALMSVRDIRALDGSQPGSATGVEGGGFSTMKRSALALCAALLLAGLIPGSTLAYAPPTQPNVDQQNGSTSFDADTASHGAYYGFAQTFTVGKTGMLSGVSLYIGQTVASNITVKIDTIGGSGMPVGNDFAHGTTSVGTAGWYHFSFVTPLGVAIGDHYVIVCGDCAGVVVAGTSADLYAGGYAMIDNNQAGIGKVGWAWGLTGFPEMADLAFITYVDTVKAALSWDKGSISAGASTSLVLTAKLTYSNWMEPSAYHSQLVSWPTWFKPKSIVCTGQQKGSPLFTIDSPTCTLAKFESLFTFVSNPAGILSTLTFVVTGTADPAATEAGKAGVADGEGCLVYGGTGPGPGVAQPDQPDPACGSDTATVSVVGATPVATPTVATPTAAPTQAPTPPPTSTGVGSSSDGSGGIVWFLPIGMVALFGGLFATTRRRRRVN
jgi:hypothetical protein